MSVRNAGGAQLGLSTDEETAEADAALFRGLLDCMQATGADFTNTFRALMTPVASCGSAAEVVSTLLPAVSANLATADDMRVATTPRIEEERVKMLVSFSLRESCFVLLWLLAACDTTLVVWWVWNAACNGPNPASAAASYPHLGEGAGGMD
jgi:hypothetical protein